MNGLALCPLVPLLSFHMSRVECRIGCVHGFTRTKSMPSRMTPSARVLLWMHVVRTTRVHPREPLASWLRGVVDSLPGASRPGTIPRRKRHHRSRPDLRALICTRLLRTRSRWALCGILRKKIKENNKKRYTVQENYHVMRIKLREISYTVWYWILSCYAHSQFRFI